MQTSTQKIKIFCRGNQVRPFKPRVSVIFEKGDLVNPMVFPYNLIGKIL